MKPCIVIPCFNHVTTVAAVAQAALAHAPVLVVDDGSTLPLPELPGCLRLRLEKNSGKGAALRAGLNHAAELGFTHAITMDSDGQHFAEDLPKFLELARTQPDALLVGVRDFYAAGCPTHRRRSNAVSTFWFRVETGVRLGDTQCGFRCYPLALAQKIKTRSGRYAFELEFMVRASWIGTPIVAVPVKCTYHPTVGEVRETNSSGGALPHPGPLPLREGESSASLLQKERVRDGETRSDCLPLPAGEGRGEGESVASPKCSPEFRQSHFRPVRDLAHITIMNIGLVLQSWFVPRPLRVAWSQGQRWSLRRTVREFFIEHAQQPGELSLAVGVGLFFGIVPIWGFQMIAAAAVAHRCRLNKAITLLASNISAPPLAPFVVYGGLVLGHWLFTGQVMHLAPDQVSMTSVREYFGQWVVGSVALAVLAAVAGTLITYAGARLAGKK